MASETRLSSPLAWSRTTWARAACRVLAIFAPQGLLVLALYALMGPSAGPEDLPPGMQLDRLHGWVHLAIGLSAGYVGFWRPAAAPAFVRLFAAVYLLLAILGTFTSVHLGMELGLAENVLHWVLGLAAAAVAFLSRRPAAAVP
ncbi:MAG: DUF4383 domain-containing protein [Chloroflexota bacterium]